MVRFRGRDIRTQTNQWVFGQERRFRQYQQFIRTRSQAQSVLSTRPIIPAHLRHEGCYVFFYTHCSFLPGLQTLTVVTLWGCSIKVKMQLYRPFGLPVFHPVKPLQAQRYYWRVYYPQRVTKLLLRFSRYPLRFFCHRLEYVPECLLRTPLQRIAEGWTLYRLGYPRMVYERALPILA